MGLWATIDDVKQLTGADISNMQRNLAAQAVEMATGAIEAVITERTYVSDRDNYWLKLAVCYQAAWIGEQPDYLQRNAVSSVSQDGQSATMGNPDWLVLSPLARKAVRKVSWRGVRQLQIGQVGTKGVRLDNTMETYEDSLDWKPL